MKTIIEKTIHKLSQLEKVAVDGSITNVADNNKGKVTVQVDTSDESNIDESNIFSTFNQAQDVSSLKVDVQIEEDVVEEDVDEDSTDAIAEGGEDTVFGQGTNPKPEDETYLNLLKKTAPKVKVKISIDKK
jgi:hypothetical protein